MSEEKRDDSADSLPSSSDAPRIIDACIAHNELDMLEARFWCMEDHVTAFVVVDSAQTFTLRQKDGDALAELSNKEGRFKRWADRILRVHIKEFPAQLKDEWARENFQRNAISEALQKIQPLLSDVVMVSDVDEIPHPGMLKAAAKAVQDLGCVSFRQTFHYYDFGWAKKYPWNGTVMVRVSEFVKHPPQFFRNGRDQWDAVSDGGVHLSFFSGRSAIQEKLRSYPHKEHRHVADDADAIERCFSTGEDLLGRGEAEKLEPSSPPDWWPREFRPTAWFAVHEE